MCLWRTRVPTWKKQLVEKLQEQGGVSFHVHQLRWTFYGIQEQLWRGTIPCLTTQVNIMWHHISKALWMFMMQIVPTPYTGCDRADIARRAGQDGGQAWLSIARRFSWDLAENANMLPVPSIYKDHRMFRPQRSSSAQLTQLMKTFKMDTYCIGYIPARKDIWPIISHGEACWSEAKKVLRAKSKAFPRLHSSTGLPKRYNGLHAQ